MTRSAAGSGLARVRRPPRGTREEVAKGRCRRRGGEGAPRSTPSKRPYSTPSLHSIVRTAGPAIHGRILGAEQGPCGVHERHVRKGLREITEKPLVDRVV